MIKPKLIKRFFIWSENPKRLSDWYIHVLGLDKQFELNLPDDTGISLTAKNGGLIWIGFHDKVKGENKDPYRFMISFVVDSVSKKTEELKNVGVKFVAEPFLAPTKDQYCATFKDPEGNILQIFSKKR